MTHADAIDDHPIVLAGDPEPDTSPRAAVPGVDAAPASCWRRVVARTILAGLALIALLAAGHVLAPRLGHLGGADAQDMSWILLPDLREEPTQAWSIAAPGVGDLVQVLPQDADHLITHRSPGDTEGAVNTIARIDANTGETVWQQEIVGRGGTLWIVGVTSGGHPVLEVPSRTPDEGWPTTEVLILDAEKGQLLSSRELRGSASASVPVHSGPVFVVEERELSRLDTTDLGATPTWQTEIGRGVRWPALDSSQRFLSLSESQDGLIILDALTGNRPTNVQIDPERDGWLRGLGETIVRATAVDRESELTVFEPDGEVRWEVRGNSFEVVRIAEDELGIFRLTHIDPQSDGSVMESTIERLDPLTGEGMWAQPVLTDGAHIATGLTMQSMQMHDSRHTTESVLLNLENGSIAGTIDHEGVPWHTLIGGKSVFYGIDNAGVLRAWDHDASTLWSLPTPSDSIVLAPERLITSHRTDGTITAWR